MTSVSLPLRRYVGAPNVMQKVMKIERLKVTDISYQFLQKLRHISVIFIPGVQTWDRQADRRTYQIIHMMSFRRRKRIPSEVWVSSYCLLSWLCSITFHSVHSLSYLSYTESHEILITLLLCLAVSMGCVWCTRFWGSWFFSLFQDLDRKIYRR
jgi:hypothetical protein